MSTYETDEEKVEAIKKWWKENGRAVTMGLVIGLALILGWRGYNSYRDSVGQRASASFEQLLSTSSLGDPESALAQAKLLSEEFSSTTYATLAALIEAKSELELDNPQGARAALETAIASSPDPAITKIAALRLARLLIAGGDLDAAADLVREYDEGESFAGAFAAIRGDIAAAQGKFADARAAYEQAAAYGAPDAERLQLKLNDLPPSG